MNALTLRNFQPAGRPVPSHCAVESEPDPVRLLLGGIARALPGTRLVAGGKTSGFQRQGRAERRDALPGSGLWESTARLAYGTKTLTHFAAGIEALADEAALATVRTALGHFQRTAIETNTAVLAQTTAVVDALVGGGVPVVVMKGPLQQQLLYGSYFVRPVGDVDLLVRPADFRNAIDILGTVGFDPVGPLHAPWWDVFLGEHHLHNRAARWGTVDVHHRLQQPGSPQPRDTQRFIATAVSHPFRSRSVPTLSPDLVPLLSAMNLVKAFYNRERAATHACDLQLAIGTSEDALRMLLDAADRHGVRGTVLLALRVVAALFGTELHGVRDEVERMAPTVGDDTLVLMVFDPVRVSAWPKRRELLWAACGGDRVRYGRELLWTGLSEACRQLFEPRQPRA